MKIFENSASNLSKPGVLPFFIKDTASFASS